MPDTPPQYQGDSKAIHSDDGDFAVDTVGPTSSDPVMPGQALKITTHIDSPAQWMDELITGPPLPGAAYWARSKAIHVYGVPVGGTPPPPIPSCRCCAESGGGCVHRRDTFTRVVGSGFGDSDSGLSWTTGIGSPSVDGSRGVLPAGSSAYLPILDGTAIDYTFTFELGSVSSRLLAIASSDTSVEFYGDLDQIDVNRENGADTHTDTASLTLSAGVIYHAHIVDDENSTTVNVWPDGSSEPAGWLISNTSVVYGPTDSSPQPGFQAVTDTCYVDDLDIGCPSTSDSTGALGDCGSGSSTTGGSINDNFGRTGSGPGVSTSGIAWVEMHGCSPGTSSGVTYRTDGTGVIMLVNDSSIENGSIDLPLSYSEFEARCLISDYNLPFRGYINFETPGDCAGDYISFSSEATGSELASNDTPAFATAPFTMDGRAFWVDVLYDASGTKVKAWYDGSPEPDAWAINLPAGAQHLGNTTPAFSIEADGADVDGATWKVSQLRINPVGSSISGTFCTFVDHFNRGLSPSLATDADLTDWAPTYSIGRADSGQRWFAVLSQQQDPPGLLREIDPPLVVVDGSAAVFPLRAMDHPARGGSVLPALFTTDQHQIKNRTRNTAPITFPLEMTAEFTTDAPLEGQMLLGVPTTDFTHTQSELLDTIIVDVGSNQTFAIAFSLVNVPPVGTAYQWHVVVESTPRFGFVPSTHFFVRTQWLTASSIQMKAWNASDVEPLSWNGPYTMSLPFQESTDPNGADITVFVQRAAHSNGTAPGQVNNLPQRVVASTNAVRLLDLVLKDPNSNCSTSLTTPNSGCVECSDPNNPGQQLPPFTPGFMPHFRRQIGDPTTSLDSFICTLESAAMVLEWHTRGGIQVWGGELIPWCGKTEAEIMGSTGHPGTSLDNARQAWAHYGQTLDVRSGQTFADMITALTQGRAVILQGDYGQLTTAERCQSNFEGNHAISVYPYQVADRLLRGDPLCTNFNEIKISTLQAYAEALTGGPGILFAVSRPWTP